MKSQKDALSAQDVLRQSRRSSESAAQLSQRFAQHQHVIDAAVAADVKLLVYTSILRADTSSLSLATEHLATEKAIQASGLPFVILVDGEESGIPCRRPCLV